MVVFLSGIANIFLIRFQSESLHENSEILFAETVTQSLSETLIRDVIDGNKITVSNKLQKFISRENPVEFLFIVNSRNEIFSHSFTGGFPKYLLSREKNSHQSSKISLINRYKLENGLVNEYSAPLLPGLGFVLHIGINQSNYTYILSQNNRLIISVSIIIFVASLLLALKGSNVIIKPIQKFTHSVEQYGQGKQVNIEIEKDSPQEIKNLNEVLNEAIEKRNEAERQLSHQANFDVLTDLPNRSLSEDRLNQLLFEAKRNGNHVAIMFIDLDDFKKVNDSLGHEVGDKILITVGNRLKENIRAGDTIGRLGGDEFIGLFGDLNSEVDAHPLAEGLLSKFKEPILIDEKVFNISVSIGVSFYPVDGDTVSELLKKADTAMYHSKVNGKNIYSYHSKEMYNNVLRRLEIEENMFKALSLNEFKVYFQPQISLKTNQLRGFEALIRWNNSKLGFVSPEEFIPIAEHTGLIAEIGKFVIKGSIEFISRMNKKFFKELTISVNFSPAQFRDSHLVSFINNHLEAYDLNPRLFEVEITENVLLQESDKVFKILDSLNELNLKISMDDFGTGYSSLSYLRRFPFDSIKIDRSFVQDMEKNSSDKILIEASLNMAHALNLNVIAEGVETKEQLEFLAEKNCDIGQGYFLGKPMEESKAEHFISSNYNA